MKRGQNFMQYSLKFLSQPYICSPVIEGLSMVTRGIEIFCNSSGRSPASSGSSASRRRRDGSKFIESGMSYQVYIIFSQKLVKYYAGHTADLDKRIADHNSGKADFTSKGIPWKLIHTFECNGKSEAVQLETSIKKRGIKRYLQDRNILQ
jgi:putative endonuclease